MKKYELFTSVCGFEFVWFLLNTAYTTWQTSCLFETDTRTHTTSLKPTNSTCFIVNLQCNSLWQLPQKNNSLLNFRPALFGSKPNRFNCRKQRHQLLPHWTPNWRTLPRTRITPHPPLTALQQVTTCASRGLPTLRKHVSFQRVFNP